MEGISRTFRRGIGIAYHVLGSSVSLPFFPFHFVHFPLFASTTFHIRINMRTLLLSVWPFLLHRFRILQHCRFRRVGWFMPVRIIQWSGSTSSGVVLNLQQTVTHSATLVRHSMLMLGVCVCVCLCECQSGTHFIRSFCGACQLPLKYASV